MCPIEKDEIGECPNDVDGRHSWVFKRGTEDVSLYKCRNCGKEYV